MASKNNVTSVSLTDEIAQTVRGRILRGDYEIGEKIKETAIADELKVSRTPIREAFKLLEKEGLIEYIPNRGCFAKGFTQRDIDDIYDVRKALEMLTLEWAVDRITSEEIEELRLQCDLMEKYTRRKDTDRAIEFNSKFHDIIYIASGSRFITQILHSYKDYINCARAKVLYNQDYLYRVIDEHKDILDAITARDKERAKAAMAAHLDGAKERAQQAYFEKKGINVQ